MIQLKRKSDSFWPRRCQAGIASLKLFLEPSELSVGTYIPPV